MRAEVYLQEHATQFPGVSVREVNLREYPHGRIGGIVLGQIRPITADEVGTAAYRGIAQGNYVGQAGLEFEYNSILQGKPGVEKVQVDAAGLPDRQGARRDAADRRREPPDLDQLRARARGLHRDRPRDQAGAPEPQPREGGCVLRDEPVHGTRARAGLGADLRPEHVRDAAELRELRPPAERVRVRRPRDRRAVPDRVDVQADHRAGRPAEREDHRADAPGRRLCVQISTRSFCNSGSNDYGDVDLVQALQESVDTYFYRLGAELNCATCDDAAIQHEARALGLGERPGIDLPGGGRPGTCPTTATRWRQQGLRGAVLPARGRRPHTRATTLAIVGCAQGYFDPGRSARTSSSPPGRAISRRARCRWRSPTRRSPTAARSGSRRSRRRSAPPRASSCSSFRRPRYATSSIDPLPAADDRRACTRRRRARPAPPTPCSATSRRRSTARPARRCTTARPTSRGTWPTSPTPRARSCRGHDPAGRLRRRRRGARGAADALAVVRPAQEVHPARAPTADGRRRASRKPQDERDPRRSRRAGRAPARPDPDPCGDRAGGASLVVLNPISHGQMVRQAAFLGAGAILMVALSRIDYSRLRELKWAST